MLKKPIWSFSCSIFCCCKTLQVVLSLLSIPPTSSFCSFPLYVLSLLLLAGLFVHQHRFLSSFYFHSSDLCLLITSLSSPSNITPCRCSSPSSRPSVALTRQSASYVQSKFSKVVFLLLPLTYPA